MRILLVLSHANLIDFSISDYLKNDKDRNINSFTVKYQTILRSINKHVFACTVWLDFCCMATSNEVYNIKCQRVIKSFPVKKFYGVEVKPKGFKFGTE